MARELEKGIWAAVATIAATAAALTGSLAVMLAAGYLMAGDVEERGAWFGVLLVGALLVEVAITLPRWVGRRVRGGPGS